MERFPFGIGEQLTQYGRSPRMTPLKQHCYWYIVPPEMSIEGEALQLETLIPDARICIKPGLQDTYLNLFRLYRTTPSELPDGLIFCEENKHENVCYIMERIRNEGLDGFIMPVVIFTRTPGKWKDVSVPDLHFHTIREGESKAEALSQAIALIYKQ